MTRVIVCLGGGGVGKTTVAAATALAGALRGNRALVMTVDPARRLAHALGLDTLGDEPRVVPGAGRLEALMLDQKRAWDRLVARHAPSPEAAERLLENRFYRDFSAQFAGTHEYLAVEQLCAVVASDRHDLVVLDTPPAEHAFEFLDAPARLDGLFDRRLLRWLLMPHRAGRFGGKTVRFLVGELEHATGASALVDLADFFAALSSLFDSLERRARELRHLLARATTSMVLVASPDPRGAREAETWAARMTAQGLPPSLIVVNRAHIPSIEPTPDRATALAALAASCVTGPTADWLVDTFLARERVAAAQSARIARLRSTGHRVAVVPDLESDVHDLFGLSALALHLDGAL
jgi:anion-transporting  ArsA/GET3 family ATPase